MNDIQKARDVLKKWRDAASDPTTWGDPGEWVDFHDACLVIGTAGNPDLLDAIDLVLNGYLDIAERYRPTSINHLAAAIIAADQRMQQ